MSANPGINNPRAWLPLLLIVLAAATAYANAWPDALVHDDKFFSGSSRFTDLSNIPRYFTENVLATSAISEPLYRPLLLSSITLDARIYGDWVAGYHLTNIALHVVVSLLLFGFVRQVLRMAHGPTTADLPAALAVALIFAVHPVYTEAVNSVFNRSEILVALAGLAGLLWFLRRVETRPASAWTGLGVAYLFALFCKESAIVLPGIAVMLALLLTAGPLPARLKKCLPVAALLIPLVFYLALRAFALAPVDAVPVAGPGSHADQPQQAQQAQQAQIAQKVLTPAEPTPSTAATAAATTGPSVLPGAQAMVDRFRVPNQRRIMGLFGFWYEAVKVMTWPVPLSVEPRPIAPSSQMTGLVLLLMLVALALYRARNRHYGLLMGLAFFYIATLPASRIVGDPGLMPHLAERYLYFPSVGLAISLAFGFRYAVLRTGVAGLASAVLLLMLLLTPITWARNAAWASGVALFESEYQTGKASENILLWLTAAHLAEAGFERVAEVCDRHGKVRKGSGRLSMHCATAYARLGRVQEAEAAYLFAATRKNSGPVEHANLARFYFSQRRWSEAEAYFEQAIEKEPLPAKRAVRRGEMLALLYPRDREKLLEAKALFEEALEIQPAFSDAQRWLARMNVVLDAQPQVNRRRPIQNEQD